MVARGLKMLGANLGSVVEVHSVRVHGLHVHRSWSCLLARIIDASVFVMPLHLLWEKYLQDEQKI